MKKPLKTPLKLVKSDEKTGRPVFCGPPLGVHGQALWTSIMREYDISDTGGIEILVQICMAKDRAEQLAAQVERDGPVIMMKTGLREHPSLKHELGCRAFITRNLQRLGLNLEVVKSPGRPGNWSR